MSNRSVYSVVKSLTSNLAENQVFPSRSALVQAQPAQSQVIVQDLVSKDYFLISRAGTTYRQTAIKPDDKGEFTVEATARRKPTRTVYTVVEPQTSGLKKGDTYPGLRPAVKAMKPNSTVKLVDALSKATCTVSFATRTFRVTQDA